MAFNFARYNTTGTPFMKLQELYDSDPEKVHRVMSVYVNNKGQFDPAPVAVCDGYKINLPAHLTPAVEEMLSNIEAVAAIKRGEMGIKCFQYENTMGTFIGAEFVNVTAKK